MATLPDVDTTGVSFLAYWNAIDQGGVSSIDPSEALSAGGINSYTLYDNGWEGDYNLKNNRTMKVRVKTDGWIVAWLDRTEAFQTQNGSYGPNVWGPWDLLNDWTQATDGQHASIAQNKLVNALNSLRTELSNSGSMTYTASSVGLYNYQYSSATTATLLAEATSSAPTVGLSYTSGTTRAAHYLIGSGKSENLSGRSGSGSFEGVTLYNMPEGNRGYGTYDALGNNLFPNSSTEYTGNPTNQSHSGVHGHLCHLVLWN